MNKQSFLLSAALTLGACAKHDAPLTPPVSGSAVNQPVKQEDSSSGKPSINQNQKDKLAGLIAEQISLHDRMETMDPRISRICMEVHQDCLAAYNELFKKMVPADVMAICHGTFNDPESTCVDHEMIERGLADELIAVYESSNACLRKITIECPPKAELAKYQRMEECMKM